LSFYTNLDRNNGTKRVTDHIMMRKLEVDDIFYRPEGNR